MTENIYKTPTNPDYGLTIPVKYVSNVDGDTVTVRLRTGQSAIIRLGEKIGDFDAPELDERFGPQVKEWLAGYLESAQESHVPIKLWIPLSKPGRDEIVDITDLLKLTKWHRLNARIYVDGLDLIDTLNKYISSL